MIANVGHSGKGKIMDTMKRSEVSKGLGSEVNI